jgi:hypothetical protein
MEGNTSKAYGRLNKTILIEILKMMECKEIFKLGLITLNKKIYHEVGFIQYTLMR